MVLKHDPSDELAGPTGVRIRNLIGWGVMAQVVFILSQFIILLGLTRFGTIEEVAHFGLATAIAVPVFFFFDLGIRLNVASSSLTGYGFRDFRLLLFCSLSIGAAVLLVIGSIAFSGVELIILLLIGAMKAFESISEMSYGVFQKHDRMDIVAGSVILRSLSGALLFLFLVMAGAPIVWGFAAQFVAWASVSIWLDYRGAQAMTRDEPSNDEGRWARIWELARLSVPLALNGLLSALQGSIPRYIIAWLAGATALAQFVVVAYAMQAMTSASMAIADSLVSRFSLFIVEGRRQALKKVLFKLVALFGFIGATGIILSLTIGDQVVRGLFGPEYAGLGVLLAICLVAATLRSCNNVMLSAILAAREFATVFKLRLASTVLMTLACLGGGALAGLNGVAVGMCLGLILFLGVVVPVIMRLISRADQGEQS